MVPRSKILGCLGWSLWAGLLASLVILLFSYGPSPHHGNLGKAVSNGKQVVIALNIYAAAHDSAYPGAGGPELQSGNQVFRELFKADILTDERIFNGSGSVFQADTKIGAAPAFADALLPGECFWMLLKGQRDTAHSKTPLVIESALNISWPPRWKDRSPDGLRQKGEAWPDRTVIIVRQDLTAAAEKLLPDGTLDWHSARNLDAHGKSWIDYLTPEQVAKLEYWDVEEKRP